MNKWNRGENPVTYFIKMVLSQKKGNIVIRTDGKLFMMENRLQTKIQE